MTAEKPGWLTRMRAWPRFLLSERVDPGHLYDLRGTGAIEGTGPVPVVNMGYWQGLDPYDAGALEQANYAMFEQVAAGAGPLDGAHVIDAGCGFGTNAVHLAQRHGPRRVTGVNVSAVQLGVARGRVAAANLDEVVDFVHGSVTRLPFADGSLDAVVSVEAAFHFDTREHFFAEAFRVLRPGGRLSMVDLIVPPPRNPWQRFAVAMICRSQAMPRDNVYDRAEWVARLGRAGFTIEEEESIVERVFPPFRRWMLSRPLPVLLRYDLLFIAASSPYLVYPLDYVRVVARRPA